MARGLVAAGAAAGLLALAGCNTSDVSPSPSPAAEQTTPTSAPSSTEQNSTGADNAQDIDGMASIPAKLRPGRTPLDAYTPTAAQEATLDYAQQLLAARCMREKGFEMRAPDRDAITEWHHRDAGFTRARWFGITDRGNAEAYGYGEPRLAPQPLPDVASLRRQQGADAAWDGTATAEQRMGSDPAVNGCNRGSQMQILGASGADLVKVPIADQLRNLANSAAARRADYAAVYTEWGRCLQRAGYKIPDPSRPFESGQLQRINKGMEREPGRPARLPEIQLAHADIDCKVEVDLVQRLEKIVSAEQRKVIKANSTALNQYEKSLDKSLARARGVIEKESAAP